MKPSAKLRKLKDTYGADMGNLRLFLLCTVMFCAAWGFYHLGYINGYADAIVWAKGVVWN